MRIRYTFPPMSSIEPTGYDQEEAEFKKRELEALAAFRAKLNAERDAKASNAAREAHWMRCPKCGSAMAEQDLSGVKIDKCPKCNGIYLDAGELEALVRHEKVGSGLLGRLFRK